MIESDDRSRMIELDGEEFSFVKENVLFLKLYNYYFDWFQNGTQTGGDPDK